VTREDPRCLPLIEVDLDQIRVLLSASVKDDAIIGVQRVAGGLVNTTYRITLTEPGASLCLRIYASGEDAWKREREILDLVSSSVPVAEVLFSSPSSPGLPYPCVVYRWIEGITLNECRRLIPAGDFVALADTLGRMLARIASFSFPGAHSTEPTAAPTRRSDIDALLSSSEESLRHGLARARLGGALADALWHRLVIGSPALVERDRDGCLVHGDLSGRNILVAAGNDGDWHVSAFLDWEAAFSGSALWDVGSLFRYSGRYTEIFRARFESGYREAGGALPQDWWRIARLLDATRLVETLNEPRELPVVFAECHQLIEAVVAGGI